MQIILASQSPYRRELLRQTGLKFLAHSPTVNEDEYKTKYIENQGGNVFDLCRELAKQKALSLQKNWPDAILIGSDQMVHLAGEVLGKPLSFENAVGQLSKMQGRTHELVTSLCVLHGTRILEHTDTTRITLRSLTVSQIKTYIDLDNPLDTAGSYKLERAGITLAEKIESADQSAVIGLPLITLTKFLIELGVPFPFADAQVE